MRAALSLVRSRLKAPVLDAENGAGSGVWRATVERVGQPEAAAVVFVHVRGGLLGDSSLVGARSRRGTWESVPAASIGYGDICCLRNTREYIPTKIDKTMNNPRWYFRCDLPSAIPPLSYVYPLACKFTASDDMT